MDTTRPIRVLATTTALAICVLLVGCEFEDLDALGADEAPTSSPVIAGPAHYPDQVDGDHADHLAAQAITLDSPSALREYFDGEGRAHFEFSDPFQQIGLQMNAEGVDELAVRARLDDGEWSDWEPVDIFFSEAGIHNGLVILDEPATAVEFRGGQSLTFAQIEFFEEVIARDGLIRVDSPLAELTPLGTPQEDIATTKQAIAPTSLVTTRHQWGAIQPDNVCGNVVAPYRMAIHHTAVPSSDGGNAAARVRSMQSYHMNTMDWCDIGYHFVVAQSGEIFQGRSRSNRPGAHVGGHNSGNVGIGLIGNYTSQSPPDAQLTGAGRIVEWAANNHGIALNRNAILGHREHPGQTTNCPGNQGINAIDEIIARAQGGSTEPPPPPPEPEPDPGGCVPTPDDDADGALFADFPSDASGADEAALIYNAGITNGCSSSPRMFCPDCPMTRQAMAVMLVRAAGISTSNPPSQPTFDDVPTSHTFYAEIEAAYAAGITQGCSSDEFCPGDEISRGAAAAMIHRAIGWPDEVASDAPSFSDVSEDHHFYEAIETLKQRCVTQGYADGTFRPNNEVPRRVAAIFIARAFNLENNNPCAEPGGCSPHPAFDTGDSVFADFPTDANGYEESILLANEGITAGCDPDGDMFCPHCRTSRAAMVTFLVRAAGIDTSNPPSEPTFDDVSVDSTFYGYIEAAYAAGITNGCGDGVFCPNNPVSRQAAAAMIRRTLQWDEVEPQQPTFDDVPEEHFFYGDIESLAERCVTQGYTDGTFRPNNEVPRRVAAIFIARAFNLDDINPCAEDDPSDPDDPTDPDDPSDPDDPTDPDDPSDPSDPSDPDDPSDPSDPDDPNDPGGSGSDDPSTTATESSCSAAGGNTTAPIILVALVFLTGFVRRKEKT